MITKKGLSTFLPALAISVTVSTHVQAKTEQFTEAVQDYYLSAQSLQGSVFQSAFLLEKTLNQEPPVEAIKSVGQSFSDELEAYRKNYEKLERLANDPRFQKQFSSVISKLEEDRNQEALPVLSDFSTALSSFSESLQQQTFTVYAQEGWANSGIQVEQGDIIWVESEGSWQASPNYAAVNSDGYVCRSDAYALNRNFPLGALLYRVRGSANINGMGLDSNSRGRADASGRLEFIMNDEDRRNNGGQQQLNVVVMDRDNLESVLNSFQEFQKFSSK